MQRLGKMLFLLGPVLALCACKWPSADAGDTCSEVSIPTGAISVDGLGSDWAGIAPLLTRKQGAKETTGAYRIEKLYVAADSEKIYLRIDASAKNPVTGDGGGPVCGDGTCDGGAGENPGTCPVDCGGSGSTPGFRILVKTTGGKACEISPAPCSGGGSDWCLNGHWWSDESTSGNNVDGAARGSTSGSGRSVEVWLKRKDFGDVISVYPMWARCCENNSGPQIEDEIGCVWARGVGGASGDGSVPDGSSIVCDGGVRCGSVCCSSGQTCSDAGKCQAAGPAWTQTTIAGVKAFRAIWGSSTGNIRAVGGDQSGGAVFHYAGSSWSKDTTVPSVNDLNDVWGAQGHVWAVSTTGELLHHDGTMWKKEDSGTSSRLNGVWARADNDAWVVGDNGTIRWYQGGAWGTVSSPTGVNLHAVWGSSAGAWGIVGANNTFMRRNGGQWNEVAQGMDQTFNDLHGLGSNQVWAAGTSGTLRRHDGTSWSSLTTGTTATLNGVWAQSSGLGWAVGEKGTILRFEGTTVTPENSGTQDTLYGVWAASPTEVWAVGNNGLILRRP